MGFLPEDRASPRAAVPWSQPSPQECELIVKNRYSRHPLAPRAPVRAPLARGQSLAEFAIVLPLILTLFVAITDFGYYLYDYIGTQAGLRDGARAAMQARGDDAGTPVYSDDQIKQLIVRSHGPVNPIKQTAGATTISATNEITVYTQAAVDGDDFDGKFGSVTIYVEHTHNFLFPIFFVRDGAIKIKARIRVARIPGLCP